MAQKHFLVQGATCQCQFSVEPKTDILQVKTQTKHFGNDNEAKEKLVATSKEIGQTMKKNTFGKCKKQPSGSDFLPCQITITKWSGFYDKIKYSNLGNPLLENSKATCAMGAPDCITITNHGQTAELTESNIKNSSPEVLYELLPGVNFSELDDSVLMINNAANE
jgi:hypothetical protein